MRNLWYTSQYAGKKPWASRSTTAFLLIRYEYSPIPGQDSKNLDPISKRSHTFEVSHKTMFSVQLEMVIVAIRCTNFYTNV
ncbi:uncharacterized protein FFB20_15337 [Fusarium fujikuroi]|nr:uncharacterized protein FFE2_01242 [Fusarium fujikuroi]SCO17598.1 uncharacterized protein FFB20_15337 [Fusarium fujikuroi]